MRLPNPFLLLPLFLSTACTLSHPSPARLVEVQAEVRSFAQSVALGVTRRGPSAWQTYFQDSPSFFMAADGRLEFPDAAAARAAIPNLARTITKIELAWGSDVRVDPLTADLAILAAPWHETMTLADGTHIDTAGYFTAVAERRETRWQFRNAHWSTRPAPAPPR